MELHLIKSVVQIQIVKLNVKFTGHLSFQFKNSFVYEPMDKKYALTDGQCLVNDCRSLQLEATYNAMTQQYNQVHVDLIIYINTVKSKLSVGIVKLNAASKQTITYPIKKCSDKAATITLNIGYAKIDKIKDLQDTIVNVSSNNNLYKMTNSKQDNGISESVVGFFQENENNIQLSSQDRYKRSVYPSTRTLNKNFSQNDFKWQEIQQNFEKKIKLLNKEKQFVQEQLSKVKEKFKTSERKEKEALHATKEVKDLAQKRRLKIIQLEMKVSQLQKAIEGYERKLKATQSQIRSNQEKYQNSLSKCSFLEKKIESKQQISFEREKKFQEKIQKLQTQNTQTTLDFNTLLQKLDSQQRQKQINLKNKDKMSQQERLKLKQEIEKLQLQVQKHIERVNDLEMKNNSLNQHSAALTLKLSSFEAQLQNTQRISQERRILLQTQQSSRRQLTKELQGLATVELDKNNLKKKYNDCLHQNMKFQQKLQRISLENQEFKEFNAKNELNMQQLKRQKKTMTSRLAQLQKTTQLQQKQLSKYAGQTNNYSSKNQFLNQRLNDLKTKLDQQKHQKQEKQANYINKINSLLQSREYLESDVEDLKWSCQKEKENCYELQRKLKDKNDQKYRYEQDFFKHQKEKESYQEKIAQLSATIEKYKGQLQENKKKEKQLIQLDKQKQNKIYKFNKKVLQLEQENYVLQGKFTQSTHESHQTVNETSKRIDDLLEDLHKQKTLYSKLQDNFQQLQNDDRKSKRQIKLLTITNDQNQKALRLQKQSNTSLKKQKDQISKKLSQTEDKLTSDTNQFSSYIIKLKEDNESLQKSIKGLSNELEGYKKSVKQLMIIMGQQTESNKNEELVAFSDKDLAKSQLQSITLKNKYITNYKQKISELETQITLLSKQIKTKDSLLDLKQIQLQTSIKNANLKLNEYQTKWFQERQQWSKRIQQLNKQFQTTKSSKEKIQMKLQHIVDLYGDQVSRTEERLQTLVDLQEKIRQLEDRNLQMKSKSIKDKSQQENQLHQLRMDYDHKIQQYKEKVKQMFLDNTHNKKIILENDKLLSQSYERTNKQDEQKSKLEAEKSQLQKEFKDLVHKKQQLLLKINDFQLKIVELSEAIKTKQIALNNKEEIIAQLKDKYRIINNQHDELAIKLENISAQLSNAKEASSHSIQQHKSKINLLQQNLASQSKKLAFLKTQFHEKKSQFQIKDFYSKEIELRLQQHNDLNTAFKKQLEQKKIVISGLNQQIADLKNLHYGAQKEKDEVWEGKNATEDELRLKKQEIIELQEELKENRAKIQQLTNNLEDGKKQISNLNEENLSISSQCNQSKEIINDLKKEILKLTHKEGESKNKTTHLQEDLRAKQSLIALLKAKNTQESLKQILSLKQKIKNLQAQLTKSKQIHENYQEDNQGQMQFLEQRAHQMEAQIIQKQNQLIKLQKQNNKLETKIIQLNQELRNVMAAWEKQKLNADKNRKPSQKFQEQLNQFQNYGDVLQKKAKDLMTSSTVKK